MIAQILQKSRIKALSRSADLVGAAGWVSFSFVAQQILRLVSNVVLARLLAPELMGTMVLINSLRTGGDLITDVGIGQSIVKDQGGDTSDFYSTAWTIQVVRGVLLWIVSLLSAYPLANLFGKPELLYLIPVCGFVFVLSGLSSPAMYILQKRMRVRKLASFSICTAIASLLIHILLAVILRDIWALVWGLLVSSAISAMASYLLIRDLDLKFKLDRVSVGRILHFGKWVFLSSLIYFGAMNFDRLYLASTVSFSVLGVYGIARTLADALTLLFQRLGSLVVFPRISASALRGGELRSAIAPLRKWCILGLSVSLALAVSVSDALVNFLYDERYAAAGLFLPLMLVGAWFALLAVLSDAIMMGIGRPSEVALANGVKLGLVVLLVPLVIGPYGVIGAVFVFAVAEAARYIVLVSRKRSHGISFIRQDIGGTFLFLVLALVFREGTSALGLTGGVASWISQAGALSG